MNKEYKHVQSNRNQNDNNDDNNEELNNDENYYDSLDYMIDRRIIKMYNLEFKEFK